MKILVFLLLALLFVAILGARPTASDALPGYQRNRWLISGTILVLRITRGALALVTFLAVFMAFRLLLVSGASARSQADATAWWVFAGVAIGTSALLYFLFWTLRRIRQRVNHLHVQRGFSGELLLARNWSF